MDAVTAITTLDEMELSQEGEVISMFGNLIELKVSEHVSVGAPVKVELNDTLSLGEVTRCRQEASGYMLCVEMSEALRGLRGLSKLAKALIG